MVKKNLSKKKKINTNIKTKKNVCAPFVSVGGIQKGMARCVTSKGKKTKKCANRKVQVIQSVNQNTCLTKEAVMKLIGAWNKSYPKNKIQINKKNNKSADDLYQQLRIKMSSYCKGNEKDKELCWLSKPFEENPKIKNKINDLKNLYRPEAPDNWKENPEAWLSTIDIEELLKQYETKYPDFKCFGAVPIDFDLKDKSNNCVVSELCQVNLQRLVKKDKKKYIGIVFNPDKHTESGTHWISMFCNIPKKQINYWDSYGYKPPKEVTELMNKLKKQAKDMNINMKIKLNKKRHQYKGNACGIYSSHFIIQQLEGKTFEEVVNNIIKDDEMNANRSKFFSL